MPAIAGYCPGYYRYIILSGWPSLPSRISFSPTRVWGYGVEDTETGSRLACPLWPGVTLENTRNKTVTVKYVNRLPAFNT